MAEGELRSGDPSGRAARKRHPLSWREAGRIKRPPAGGDEAQALAEACAARTLASWPAGLLEPTLAGAGFMVTPTFTSLPSPVTMEGKRRKPVLKTYR